MPVVAHTNEHRTQHFAANPFFRNNTPGGYR
jgi:hypothetical protein